MYVCACVDLVWRSSKLPGEVVILIKKPLGCPIKNLPREQAPHFTRIRQLNKFMKYLINLQITGKYVRKLICVFLKTWSLLLQRAV